MIKLIKSTFNLLFFTYRNIFHWIFSKILIVSSTFLMWILLSLPLLLIIILIIYLSPLTLWNFLLWSTSILWEFLLNKWWFTLIGVLLLFNIFIFTTTLNYKRILLVKLNFKYIDKEKLKFTKNEYFNFNLLFKNIKINLIIFFCFLFITLIFTILFLILVLIFWGITNINNLMIIDSVNSFSIISLFLGILYFIVLLYFLYRVYFSFYILLENKDLSPLQIIKKSFKKTRKNTKLFKFIWILLVFFILLLPVNYLWQSLKFNNKSLEYYISLKNKKILKQEKTNKENIDFIFLDKEYWKYNNKELVEKFDKNSILKTIYLVLHFLLIFGIFDLVLANFYKREIK